MRKHLILLLLAMAGVRLFAQTGLHVGFALGPQFTKMINNEAIDPEAKGFAYKTTFGKTGMFKLGYNVVPPIGFYFAAIYSVQGQDYTTVDTAGVQSTTSRRATYIKVPIMLHTSSTPGPIMFSFDVGPQIGILRAASYTVNGTPIVTSFPTTQLWKPNDFAVAWALGVEFCPASAVHFTLQHRGDYGLFDFENKRVSSNGIYFYPSDRKKANNLTLGITAGVEFVITGGHSKVTRHYKGKTWRNNWR